MREAFLENGTKGAIHEELKEGFVVSTYYEYFDHFKL